LNALAKKICNGVNVQKKIIQITGEGLACLLSKRYRKLAKYFPEKMRRNLTTFDMLTNDSSVKTPLIS